MYLCMFSLSFSRLSFSLTFFSRSLSLALSLSFYLSNLSSLPLSLAVSLQVFVTWYLYVSRKRARLFSSSQTFSVSLSLSLFLSCSLVLFFSFFFMCTCVHTKTGKLAHMCTYQNWEACTQPHLYGFTLGNSLERWCFFNRAEHNVVEFPHTRCPPPVEAQVPTCLRPLSCPSAFLVEEASVRGLFITRSKA